MRFSKFAGRKEKRQEGISIVCLRVSCVLAAVSFLAHLYLTDIGGIWCYIQHQILWDKFNFVLVSVLFLQNISKRHIIYIIHYDIYIFWIYSLYCDDLSKRYNKRTSSAMCYTKPQTRFLEMAASRYLLPPKSGPRMMMLEAARTPEALVNVYQATRLWNAEDSHLRTHRRENLRIYWLVYN